MRRSLKVNTIIFSLLDLIGLIGAIFYQEINKRVFYGNEEWLTLGIPQSIMIISSFALIFFLGLSSLEDDECKHSTSSTQPCCCPKCIKKKVNVPKIVIASWNNES